MDFIDNIFKFSGLVVAGGGSIRPQCAKLYLCGGI